MPSSIRRSCLQALGLLLLCSAFAAQAQTDWPSRPITLVVGYSPGGGSDAMARIVGAKMATRLGQPVVVENRPVGGGQIADAYVARSAPNGYTLVIDASPFAINLGLGFVTVNRWLAEVELDAASRGQILGASAQALFMIGGEHG